MRSRGLVLRGATFAPRSLSRLNTSADPTRLSHARAAAQRDGCFGLLRRALYASAVGLSAFPLDLYRRPLTACTSAARAFHCTALTHSGAAATPSGEHEDSNNDSGVGYQQDRHVENADAVLREMYGPQAKMAVRRQVQRHPRHSPKPPRGEDGAEHASHSPAAGADVQRSGDEEEAGVYYRASVTFRLLGFPVELAAASGPRLRETIDSCLRQALSSDIAFIHPGSQRSNNSSSSSSANHNHNARGRGSQQDRRHARGGNHRRGNNNNSSYNNQSMRSGFSSVDVDAAAASARRGSGLTPHQVELKSILDELRQLCVHFSRSVKFSIKPPAASTGGSSGSERQTPSSEENTPQQLHQQRQWRCRCYTKEEWGTTAQARLIHDVTGSSPSDALVRCVAQLRQDYKEEMASPAVLEEGVREVAGAVQGQHKTVSATCTAEQPRTSTTALAEMVEVPTHRAQIDVTDARGNVTTYMVNRQPSPYVAYEAAAVMALRGEALWDPATELLASGVATPPLLWRLRWQFDLLVDHICRETGQSAAEVAWIHIRGETQADVKTDEASVEVTAAGSSPSSVLPEVTDGFVPHVPTRFTGSLYSEREVLVWQTSGGGRYRVEFDTYVQALYHLLDQYADCLAALPCMARGVGERLLFPDAAVLDFHVHRHDAFAVLSHHKGNLNCYALLGTLTSQLLGCHYTTHYHLDRATGEHVATLTVNDGRVGQQPLIQRRSKQKGEAWRFACLDAIRENFPRQYAAILNRHPEVDLSSEDVATSTHMRALPREKRLPFFSSFAVMVLTFAEEELGWRQPRMRMRNQGETLGVPSWVGELEALVDGEEVRRVVAVSPAFPQMQNARRSLIFRIGSQYFPEDVARYKALGRRDVINPEEVHGGRVNKFYMPNAAAGASMLSHVVALMEAKQPTHIPVRATVEARLAGRLHVDEGENGVSSAAAGEGEELDLGNVEGDTAQLLSEDPIRLLRPLRLAYTARVLGNRGDLLIADFDSDSATTAADAQAVPVLVTALKSASFHVAGGDAEALWTEYETHPLPPVVSTRTLMLILFDRFFGSASTLAGPTALVEAVAGSGRSSGGATADGAASAAREMDETGVNYNASITVVTAQLGEYWFGTAVIPQLGMLPIARAVATTKRKCVIDAMIVATRRSFPRLLHYTVKHDVAAAPFAAEVLTEPVVEQLPDAAVRDLRSLLARKRAVGPPPPFPLLLKCTAESYPNRERFIRVQRTHSTTHGFQCRLYLQRGKAVRPGDTQLVGYGASVGSPSAALHQAAIVALENLFEAALHAAMTVQPDYCDPPAV